MKKILYLRFSSIVICSYVDPSSFVAMSHWLSFGGIVMASSYFPLAYFPPQHFSTPQCEDRLSSGHVECRMKRVWTEGSMFCRGNEMPREVRINYAHLSTFELAIKAQNVHH